MKRNRSRAKLPSAPDHVKRDAESLDIFRRFLPGVTVSLVRSKITPGLWIAHAYDESKSLAACDGITATEALYKLLALTPDYRKLPAAAVLP